VTLLEHRRRAAEDEIDPALDVAAQEVRPAGVDVERVLPAEHATVVKRLSLAGRAQRHRLADFAR
jgi:hypothetical protein